MKLKYKKIILLTTISTMGIGLLTLSVSNDRTKANETSAPKAVQEAGLLSDDNSREALTTITAAPTATPIPSPTPLPVYNIDEKPNQEIKTLFHQFYKAKNNRDVEAIKKLLSNPSKVDTKDELQKRTQYIEEYSNINAYAKKGYIEGTFIVYVYHEIKFTGIKTPAPGLSKFYVITDEDNKLKIFSGDMDDVTKEYYGDRNNDEDVVKLIEMTNKKSKKAMKNDKDLKTFWDNIKELAKKKDTKTAETSVE